MLKKFVLPLAVFYTISLTVLSLIRLNGMPGIGTDYDDKLYHIIAYALLTFLWYLAIKKNNFNISIIQIVIGCISFGIVIEALQGKLISYRAGDVLDVVANVIGVVIATLLILRSKSKLS